MIGKVFLKVKNVFFDISVCFGVFNIVCFLVGSKLIDRFFVFVQEFRDLGVIVIIIGMGNRYCSRQLGNIVIDLNLWYMFKVEFDVLGFLVGFVVDICCKGEFLVQFD